MVTNDASDTPAAMLFASTIFLLVFLPTVVLCYYTQKVLLGNRLRNSALLLASYLFYLFGAAEFVLILLASTVVDYLLGLFIERRRRWSRWWVALSVLFNLGLLGYFKYANFMVSQADPWLTRLGITGHLNWVDVALPIGISFFTFQKLSYVIDIHRGEARALDNFTDFALYVAMFPQLVAGPIVRFKDLWEQLKGRQENWSCFYLGAMRFSWGLAKKVFIADGCGQVADVIFGMSTGALDTKMAWLGALAYTFQIYFDFSAYSDMAIGLARLFGFELRENFNRPYAAGSMTDFWRRWHISLSTWFRDYLYIPLGGNRRGAVRTAVNLLIVFGLCGFWHGANWTFLIWGLYHGFFLSLERLTGWRDRPTRYARPLRRLVTFLIVVFGWVLFRTESVGTAMGFMHAMVVPANLPLPYDLFRVLNPRNITFLLIAAAATIGAQRLPAIEQVMRSTGPVRTLVSAVLILLLLPYCAGAIMTGTENPFIYFRF